MKYWGRVAQNKQNKIETKLFTGFFPNFNGNSTYIDLEVERENILGWIVQGNYLDTIEGKPTWISQGNKNGFYFHSYLNPEGLLKIEAQNASSLLGRPLQVLLFYVS